MSKPRYFSFRWRCKNEKISCFYLSCFFFTLYGCSVVFRIFLPCTEKNAAPSNDVETVPPHEHTEREHNHSSEESSAEETEFEALMKEILLAREEREASQERVQNTKDRAFPKMISLLTLKSPEEQRTVLMQTKDWLYNEFPTSPAGAYLDELSFMVPDFNMEEGLKYAWNSVLTDLVKYGYTLPAGVEKV